MLKINKFSFTRGGFNSMDTVPRIAALSSEIRDAKRESGFDVPSDFFDQWLEEIYCPEHLGDIKAQFGCPNMADGTIVDCWERMDRYLTSKVFACNSRFAFNGEGLKEGWDNGTLAPIYPMEFRYRNCGEDENGVNTKTCHCEEGTWINGNERLDNKEAPWDTFGQEIEDAFGQFFRQGTFPENTIKSYGELELNAFNVLDGS